MNTDFEVQGRDIDALLEQAHKMLRELVGENRPWPSFDLSNISPIAMTGGGDVALWQATVNADVLFERPS